jgi:energy-coupling factor transport system substrate-specific component
VLAVFGALWGLLFGAIMNIWFWPYAMGPSSMYWEPGIGVVETMQRYAVFYAATSLVWDLMRAAGNAILILLMGEAVLRVLRRFHQRFDFIYRPLPVEPAPAPFGGTPLPAPTPVGSEI